MVIYLNQVALEHCEPEISNFMTVHINISVIIDTILAYFDESISV